MEALRMDAACTEWVEGKLAESVRQALGNLGSAKLAIGHGCAEANINRRARDAGGQIRPA